MNDILNDGCCPTSAALLDGACTAIPAAREELLVTFFEQRWQ